MPARASFSYAVLRVVPRVDRGEFVNAGVVLHCPARGYLAARVALDAARLTAAFPDADLAEIQRHLLVVCALCDGDVAAAGPLARASISERFHWIVAPRSTVVQTSPVHAGLTTDPAGEIERLLASMVPAPAAG